MSLSAHGHPDYYVFGAVVLPPPLPGHTVETENHH